MRQKKCWLAMSGILALLAMALMLPSQAVAGSQYKGLHRFNGRADGAFPFYAGLVFDGAGNLYGTTEPGGLSTNCPGGCGTVFKLKPNSNGSWTESVLYTFTGGTDGGNPFAGLIFDPTGNLYGTTADGTVFKLKPNSDGSWTESVLYSFCSLTSCADGAYPNDALAIDAAGNLYGTTGEGGTQCSNCGTVFKLKPNSDGSWTESVLHSFADGSDGAQPVAGLVLDAAGNLYGTTYAGGNRGLCGGCGTVFKLTPNSDGSWTEDVLHRFALRGKDGSHPYAGLTFDGAGNLYGTTSSGGANGFGTVFKLTPDSDGISAYKVIHTFANHPGARPYAGLIFDANGNLYGTTGEGGPADGGVVFKLAPQSDGSWAFRAVHVFLGKPALRPYAGVIFDKSGNLYGTAGECGSGYNCQGVVFEITP